MEFDWKELRSSLKRAGIALALMIVLALVIEHMPAIGWGVLGWLVAAGLLVVILWSLVYHLTHTGNY